MGGSDVITSLFAQRQLSKTARIENFAFSLWPKSIAKKTEGIGTNCRRGISC